MRVRCVCLLFFFAVCFSMGAETPPGNIDYVMEYFPKAGGIVMHGGWCEPDWLPRNDVWVLDNNGWRHVIQDSSPAFAHHSMTFNTDRKVLVLCGNTTYTTFTSEYQTWEYDGTDWSRGPELPTEIIFGDVELAYDQARQVTVLYLHGFLSDFSPRTETWEYNGVTWTKKEFLTAPVACSDGALMKYDPVNRITVLVADDGSGSQTWLWDGTDWKSVAGAQPPDVLGGGMVYDTVRQEMVFLTTTMQTWVFDGTSWTQKNPAHSPQPVPNGLFSMAFDPVRRKTVFFGGESPPLGSFPVYPTGTWEWDGADWREFSSSLQGDINGDGELDIRDVVICLRIVLGWNDFDSRADLNGDGQVNIQDVILLLRVVLA